MRISDWSSDVCSSDLAQMIAANPRKRATFGRGIGILAIVDPPMLGRGVERVATALDVVIARDLILVDAAPVLVLPRALHVGIIGAVLDMAATLDHQHLEPALGEFLGGPAAAHPRTDDDGVEGDRKSTRLNSSH